MPAFIVGILLMSEYIGAKSTIGTAQAAFESGIAASVGAGRRHWLSTIWPDTG